MRGMSYFLALLLLFLCPLVTMRSFADEVRLHTMELLWTAPISGTQLVFGKFLAAWLFAILMILTTREFPLIMWLFGTPELAPLLTNYMGLLLLVAAFTAVGVFMSSLVRSPMLAALLSFATCAVGKTTAASVNRFAQNDRNGTCSVSCSSMPRKPEQSTKKSPEIVFPVSVKRPAILPSEVCFTTSTLVWICVTPQVVALSLRNSPTKWASKW